MAKAREGNMWDGFDGREIVYDDKKEKSYHSRIWIVFLVIGVLMFISLFGRLGSEILLRMNGNTIEADYCKDAAKTYARVYDEDGKLYTINLAQFFTPVHDGDKITLYYYDDIIKARPMSSMSAWVGYFGFFGLMLGISIWRLYAIWKPKSHVPIEE